MPGLQPSHCHSALANRRGTGQLPGAIGPDLGDARPAAADRAREEKRAAAVLSPQEGWFLCYYLAECSHAAQIFLVVLVLVPVLDWVSGLDYEDDSVAAAPLRALS